jgi:2-methylisocitrate lyase-like PEP mutase family enzyme
MNSNHIKVLRQTLLAERGVLLPGAPNALAARVIADLGFKAVYLTGAGLTNMHLVCPISASWTSRRSLTTQWQSAALWICRSSSMPIQALAMP